MIKRTEQVNIRLSRKEKTELEVAAIARGYTSLSAFIRCSAIAFLERKNENDEKKKD